MLAAVALAAPVSAGSSPACHLAVTAPVHTGGAPGKTTAAMTFTCTKSFSQATGTVRSQALIRGQWIHEADRTVTLYQVKAGHHYRVTTPTLFECLPGSWRTLGSVKAGGRTTSAQSSTTDITCA